MNRILKWAVPLGGPAGRIGRGRIVHVGMTPDQALPDNLKGTVVWVWVEHDDGDLDNPRTATIVGTGNLYDGDMWEPIGSVIDREFVWHVIAERID